MDYSLLVGIHNLDLAAKEKAQKLVSIIYDKHLSYKIFYNFIIYFSYKKFNDENYFKEEIFTKMFKFVIKCFAITHKLTLKNSISWTLFSKWHS